MDKQNKYDWKFSSIGGVTRVTITTGDDIAHLAELDQKLWTVLSCPVDGLEFDRDTLAMLDTDGDGKVRVNEVVAASQWLTKALHNPDLLLDGADHIALSAFNENSEEGATLLAAAKRIFSRQGSENEEISLADIDAVKAAFDSKVAEKDAAIAVSVADNRPYGDNTDAAIDAVAALKAKVDDYFMRCKLIAFDEDCGAALDVSVEKIQSISDNNLSTCTDQIASYPLARPSKDATLPLSGGINPAWQASFDSLKNTVFAVDYPDASTLNEQQWQAVVAKIDTYVASFDSEKTASVELFDKEMAEENDDITLMNKFLHLFRDFYTLLKNYVVFADFYTRDPQKLAVFQCGKLYIDQRCCDLCIKVTDMSKHGDMAGLSGIFLVYCTCTSKVKNATMDIVAALTDGDISDLRPGKNAIFYDRDGQDWDAVVTKVIDNPISIRQAFWSPYKKLWNWITEKINKSASEKEAASMENLTAKTDGTLTNLQTGATNEAGDAATAKKQPFDIAKFAGIFAAIGMAIGFILDALVGLGKGITDKWYNLPLLIIGIILVISGPSMFIAWTKLRKRNLGPVLNANGWAINSQVRVNTVFGATLTSLAKYPRVTLPDPYADKKTPAWKKWLFTIILLCAIFAALFFTNSLRCIGLPFHKDAEAEIVEDVNAPADADQSIVSEPAPEELAPAPDGEAQSE